MPVYQSDIAICPRRVIPVFFLLDTSGSMFGERIAALNESMRYMLEAFMHESFTESGREIRVSVLQMSSACHWVTHPPTPVEDIYWEDLQAYGLSSFGAAFRELEHQLNRNAMFPNNEIPGRPVVVFMADGHPTDAWEQPLGQLWDNRWYQRALKMAFGIGDSICEEFLEKVTGNKEAVFLVDNGHELVEKMVELVRILHPEPPIPILDDPHESEMVVTTDPFPLADSQWENIW